MAAVVSVGGVEDCISVMQMIEEVLKRLSDWLIGSTLITSSFYSYTVNVAAIMDI